MHSRLERTFGIWLPVLTIAAAAGNPALAAAPESSIDVEQRGKKLYRRYCVQCHGRPLNRFAEIDQHTFSTSVIRGVNLMPGFGTRLSQADIETLWIYLTPQKHPERD